MLKPTPPLSNVERQQRFRASHPGYSRRYKVSSRPAREAALAELRAVLAAESEAAAAGQGQPVATADPAAAGAGNDDPAQGTGRDL
jgi:hypothetical protein